MTDIGGWEWVQAGNRFVSFRSCARACVRSGCLVEFDLQGGCRPFPFSFFAFLSFPFSLVWVMYEVYKVYKEYTVYEVYEVFKACKVLKCVKCCSPRHPQTSYLTLGGLIGIDPFIFRPTFSKTHQLFLGHIRQFSSKMTTRFGRFLDLDKRRFWKSLLLQKH